jgi:hypothetical protein
VKTIKIAMPNELAHVLSFTHRTMSRPILAAVHFRARDHAMIATNGHVLAMYREAHDSPEDISLTIPFAATAIIECAHALTIEHARDDLYIVRTTEPEWYGARLMSDPYPDVDVLLPRGEPTRLDSIPINTEYLALFGDAMRYPELTFYGKTKAIKVTYRYNDRFLGLIMPMRDDK